MFANIVKYLIKELQQVQNATASFIIKKHTTEHYVITLGSFLIIEQIKLNFEKIGHESIKSETWPKYLNKEKIATYDQVIKNKLLTVNQTLLKLEPDIKLQIHLLIMTFWAHTLFQKFMNNLFGLKSPKNTSEQGYSTVHLPF